MFFKISLTHLLMLFILGITPELLAQNDNPVISIQGTLKDANGSSVADGEQELIFRLYDQPANGAVLWTETAPVNVVGGIYSHNLGSVEELNESNFDRKLYLGVTVGGLELFPRTELTYAPYALSVATAQRISRGACSGQVGDVKYSILKPLDFALENGECWVPMDGRDIPGTRLADYGIAAVPDMSGLFMRAAEYNDGNDPDRTPDSQVASQQDDQLGSHTHTMAAAGEHDHQLTDSYFGGYHFVRQDGGVAPSQVFSTTTQNGDIPYNMPLNGTKGNPNYVRRSIGGQNFFRPVNREFGRNTNSKGSHTHTLSEAGGNETRVKNLNFYAYIRVD